VKGPTFWSIHDGFDRSVNLAEKRSFGQLVSLAVPTAGLLDFVGSLFEKLQPLIHRSRR